MPALLGCLLYMTMARIRTSQDQNQRECQDTWTIGWTRISASSIPYSRFVLSDLPPRSLLYCR
jgi:hypothetical protein